MTALGGGAGTDLLSQVDSRVRRDRQAAGVALRLLGGLASAAASIGIVLFAWWAFLEYFNVSSFSGKGPSDVWHYLFSGPEASAHRTLMIDESKLTLRDASLGLVAGTIVAIGGAIAFNLYRPLERTFMPIALVLRSVPLIAMTPLIAIIFGRNLRTVTMIASIVTFFPTLVNVSLALRSAPKESIDLLRAYGASRFETLRKVQVPCALPALFASLRVAAPLALVGAMLAEWLATGEGMGSKILTAGALSDYASTWTRVVLVTLYSVILYKAIGAIERRMLARYAPSYGR
jgi:ABC-type nitrate/sulfonate/bicarbonate transport system permease component